MKKIFSLLLLSCILVSQFQIFPVYADIQTQLELQKEKSLGELEKVETSIESTIEKLETKIEDENILEKIQEKQEEISDYLSQVQEKIEGEDSRSEVKALVQEAKKVVVLKVVSGVTEYEDVTQNISKDIASTPLQQEQAQEVLQDTLETRGGDIRLMLRTKDSQEKLISMLVTFDPDIQVDFLYQMDQENYFELTLSEESLFAQEMLPDIKQGKIPESFISLEILSPELFSISQPDLSGENISQTWGVEQYKTYQYFENIPKDRQKIRVAVIDTGVDFSHPDLQGQVSTGYDFVNEDSNASDDQGHGSHVAGTIAANINAQGIIGVNPYVEIIPLKICTSSGFCPSYALMQALEYAKSQHIDVLNMSLGGRGVVADNPICAGIQSVTDAGAFVVAAAGNSNVDTSSFIPGGCPAALSVAAVDTAGKRAVFSNYGSKVDVAAPGVAVSSVKMGGGYKELSGTSMAAPHITGLVSLIQSFHPNVSIAEIKQLFAQFSRPVQSDSGKSIASAVDVEKLLMHLQQENERTSIVSQENIQVSEVYNTQSGNIIHTGSSQSTENAGLQEIYNPNLIFSPNIKKVMSGSESADTVLTPKILPTVSQFFDFGNKEIFQIHNSENDSTTKELLPVTQETKIIPKNLGSQSFDTYGNPFSGNSKIQDVGEKTQGILLEGSIDLEHLTPIPRSQSEIGENIIGEQEIYRNVEILIDGGKEKVAINSDESKIWENVHLEESPEFFDIYSFSGSQQAFWTPVENLHYEAQTEIFVDGAEKGVEVNSVEEGDIAWNTIDEQTGEVYLDNIPQKEDERDGVVVTEIPASEIEETQDNGNSELIEPSYEVYDSSKDIVEQDIGVQATLSCTIYIGEKCTFSYYKSYNLTLVAENPSIGKLEADKYTVYITGRSAGTVIYRYYNGTSLKNTLIIEVKTPPPPQIIEVTTVENEFLEIYFPDRYKNIVYDTSLSTGKANIYMQQYPKLNISGYLRGKVVVGFYNDYGREIYTLILNIIPKPPIVQEFSVYEGKSIRLNHGRYSSISINKLGYVQLFSDTVLGLIPGNVELYFKDAEGRHTHTYVINILAKPVLKSYEVNLFAGESSLLSFPEDINSYQLSGEGGYMFDTLQKYQNELYMSTRSPGKYTITLKDENNFDRYKIIVNVVPYTETHTLFVTDQKRVWMNPNYNFTSKNQDIATYNFRSGEGFIQGKTPGSTEIHITKDGWLRKIFYVQVLPIPQPQEISCTIEVGNECNFYVDNRAYYYQESKPGITDIDASTHRLSVTGNASGNITVYAYSPIGDYITHILRVHVVPPPAKIYTCETAVGLICESYVLEDFDTYTYTSSIPNLVVLGSTRIWKNGTRTNNAMLTITATGQGNGEVYVYKRGDHVATIQLKISPHIAPIMFSDGSIRIKEGKKITTSITSGAGKYELVSVHDFDGNKVASSELDLRVLQNGEIHIDAKKAGRYDLYVQDVYKQQGYLYIRVDDTQLTLSDEYVELTPQETKEVSIYEYYKSISKIENSNPSLVKSLHMRDSDGSETIRLIAQGGSGTAIIRVTDEEGSTWDIQVKIAGKIIPPKPTGIRYIRDWANGSDKNGTNYWVEIQAIEKDTGNNIALGKTVTGLRPGTPSYPYTRIVDGNTSSSNYAQVSGKNALTNIQVDLGALYDISHVKIWHYYTDGRVFNETKTEVSEDGLTWTTLFDSKIQGTYPEPKKGEGRSYEVKKPDTTNFTSVIYNTAQNEEGSQVIEINVEGIPQEIAMEWDEGQEKYKQILEIDASGNYLLSCTQCPSSSNIYLVTPSGEKKYASITSIQSHNNLEITSFPEGVEINSSETYSRKIAQSYYQTGVNTGIVGNGYLEGILDGAYSFLRYDTQEKWGKGTNEKLRKLVRGEITLQSQIDSVSDFKNIWTEINADIQLGTHIYTEKEKQKLKGYLAVSALIEISYPALNNQRVIDKWDVFHDNKLTPLEILNFEYTPSVDNGYLAGIYFETSKALKTVGYNLVYTDNRKYTTSLTEDGIGKIHAGIITPNCDTACSFYVQVFAKDENGNYKESDFKRVNYMGGDNNILAQNELDAIDFSIASLDNEDNIEINYVQYLIQLFILLEIVGNVTCFDDVGCINFGRAIDEVSGAAISIIKTTKKRVLELSNSESIRNLSIRIGKNGDEIINVVFQSGKGYTKMIGGIQYHLKVAKKTVQVKSEFLGYDFTVVRDFEKIMNEVAGSTPRGIYKNDTSPKITVHLEDPNYYTEWTVKTPEYPLKTGPERIITGKGGEIWYTGTHYTLPWERLDQ